MQVACKSVNGIAIHFWHTSHDIKFIDEYEMHGMLVLASLILFNPITKTRKLSGV